MPSRTRVAALILLGACGAPAVPPPVWLQDPARLTPEQERQLPPGLLPAFRFQVLYGRILAGQPPARWRADLEALASSPQDDPVSSGIRDVARVWIARAQMGDIDALLREYYARSVRFPRTAAEFQQLLPPGLSKDPWGQPWAYTPSAPRGFSPAMAAQRYTVAPASRPRLLPLKEALAAAGRPPKPDFLITPHDIAGRTALECRSPG
jgi:hypothetical protein